jgi:esterase
MLHYKKTGEGQPVIILHGLFGSGDNWATFSRMLAAAGFAAYTADLRNHGHSPWNDVHTYAAMAEDIRELVLELNLLKPVIMGHSMGAKAAMQAVISYPELFHALVVVDMSMRRYDEVQAYVFDALNNVTPGNSRKNVEEQLSLYIKDQATRQLLMKSLYWKQQDKLAWRFNYKALHENIDEIGKEISSAVPVNVATLFVKGGNSNYLSESDMRGIKNIFPLAAFITIEGAGHWVHADKPEALLHAVQNFLKNIPA